MYSTGQDCLHGLQFECTNGESKYARPDCIAVYDVCDGTPQCADGSDELDCQKGMSVSLCDRFRAARLTCQSALHKI